jgi:HD-like signal output (HDOD) protein
MLGTSQMSASNSNFQDLQQLPQFPAIATKVLRVLSHDDITAREIADFIRADAALASGLLSLANSSLYHAREHINSLQQALTMLGMDELKRFVVTFSAKSCFQTAMRLDLLRAIWRHSLACALVSEELSVACSPSQSRGDQAYTAGQLHNIGRLGLFVVHPREYADLLTGAVPGTDLLALEQEAFGVNHCEAGRWLAERWGLPEEVRVAAAEHHNPPGAGEFDLQDLVRVAVLLTNTLGFDVTVARQALTMQRIRASLPRVAQYRFDPEPDLMKQRINEKLDAFD